jgi:UDP-N-acetylglucosamine diphosphorylase/glucosamine-1-phosphate N-acetyltransferase
MTDASHLAVVILAAGKGTRMRSDRAKVLHPLLDRPMILYVVETAAQVAAEPVVVVGHQADAVKAVVDGEYDVRFALQQQQLGTGHAVACGIKALGKATTDVLILCGDVPLVSADLLRSLMAAHDSGGHDLTLVAVEMADPTGYGRILVNDTGKITGVVEEADANAREKTIRLVNAGIYCVRRSFLDGALARLRSDNAQGEYYLTDIIAIAHGDARTMGMVVCPQADQIIGINSREDLLRAEGVLARNRGKIT